MSSIARRPKTHRFPGINEVARSLGVERSHLWRVLTGRRESKRLVARIRRLRLEWKIIHK